MTQVKEDRAGGSGEAAPDLSFDDLFHQYSGLVYNLAYRFAQNPADADDISQEVWLKVHQKIGTLRSSRAFSSWLWRTTSNVCIDHARRLRNAQPLDEHIPASDNIEDDLESGLDSQLAWQALGALSHKQKLILYLKEVEDLSYRQIASAVRCSVGAVAMALFRARKELATAYQVLDTSPVARCSQSVRLMALLVDQEGDEISRRALRAHMETCLPCERAFKQMQQGSRVHGVVPMLPAIALRPMLASQFATHAPILAGLASHIQQAAIPFVASAALVIATVMPAQISGEPSLTGIGLGQPVPVEPVATRPLIASNYGQSIRGRTSDSGLPSKAVSLDRFGYPIGDSVGPPPFIEPKMTQPPASLMAPAQSVNTLSEQAIFGSEKPSMPMSSGIAVNPTQLGARLEAPSPPPIPLLPKVLNGVAGSPNILPVPPLAPPSVPLNFTQLPAVLTPPISLQNTTVPSVPLPSLPQFNVPSETPSVPPVPPLLPEQPVPGLSLGSGPNVAVVPQMNSAIPLLQPASPPVLQPVLAPDGSH